MQDARITDWQREPQVPVELLESQRELNRCFLELVAARPSGWSSLKRESSRTVAAQVAPLTGAQKAAAANCPYALFDLRFHDEGYWRTRLQTEVQRGVADAAPVDTNTLHFVELALFFAWHLATTTKFAAQLLLGMHDGTVNIFRGITLDRLPSLAVSESANLTARWNDCAAFWSALTGAASQPHSPNLRRIQLYGLQLAAAGRLV
jgi:hypothetical protein